jgi:hypothetical protein
MTRLIQLRNSNTRRIALVAEPKLRLLVNFASVYDLANAALSRNIKLTDLIQQSFSGESLDYNPIYAGESEWKVLVPIDHPNEPSRTLVTGTGLTHLGSAQNRNAMHGAKESELTDSMRMFKLGLEGGRPEPGAIGAAPEWFYKGTGTILRTHGEPLDVPKFAEDGGEEAEIAGIYLIDPAGQPQRLGFVTGNEFSDHMFEKKNYLNLAGSKLRTCALGPELAVDASFDSITGTAFIERAGQKIWSKEILTGNANMCHSLANIEHHHFKFDGHRRPGDLHVHYFGAHSLSFGEGVVLEDGDIMEVQFENFGRPLRNTLRRHTPSNRPVAVTALA